MGLDIACMRAMTGRSSSENLSTEKGGGAFLAK